MISILVADDERWIRTGIRQKIDLENQFICCGEASDGVEAYQLAVNLQPDIIITDVRMPGMDGLTVIEKLKTVLPETAIIVISGYHEFEYVKKAMDLGAVSYVLKPVSQEELVQALQKAMDYIRFQRQRTDLESPMVMISKTLSESFHDIPVNPVFFHTALRKLYENSIRFWGCLLIHINQNSMEYDMIRENLVSMLVRAEQEFPSILFEPGHSLFGIMAAGHDPLDLKALALKYLYYLKSKCKIAASISLGHVVDTPEAIASSIHTARNGLYYIHPYDANEIILPERESDRMGICFPEDLESKLIQQIYSEDSPDIAECMERIGDYFIKNGLSIGQIRNFIIIILGDILRISYQGNASKQTLNEGILLSQKAHKLQQWNDIALELEAFCIRVNTDLSDNIDHVMERAVQYLNLHFTEAVSLNKLARTFYLSPSYFSTSFKHYAKTNFCDYLTELRIRKAKELLASGNLKVMHVAEMVGYEDYSYFGKLFRKHVGMTPRAYQTSHSNKEKRK